MPGVDIWNYLSQTEFDQVKDEVVTKMFEKASAVIATAIEKNAGSRTMFVCRATKNINIEQNFHVFHVSLEGEVNYHQLSAFLCRPETELKKIIDEHQFTDSGLVMFGIPCNPYPVDDKYYFKYFAVDF